MADIFKNTQLQYGGSFAADRGLITPDSGLTGILMQNLQLTYAQNVTRIYEIGNAGEIPHVYYIGGRSQGNMSVAHIVGPAVVLSAFYNKFANVCNALTNDIQIQLTKAACNPGGGSVTITYKAKFCVLIQIGMSVGAQDLVINESSQLMFSNLEFSEGNGFAGVGAFGVGANVGGAAAATLTG
jgi:hypothetical protein